MWSTWEIVAAICVGIPVLIAAIRFGFIGVILEILFAVLTGGKGGSSSGGSSSGRGFGGGSSGGGGSSSKW
jgi:uncharacterized protein